MAFVAERNELLEQHKNKWEKEMKHRRDKEVDYMKNREKRVEDYENQLQHLRVQDAEEYNMVKIRLETDVQVLSCCVSTFVFATGIVQLLFIYRFGSPALWGLKK